MKGVAPSESFLQVTHSAIRKAQKVSKNISKALITEKSLGVRLDWARFNVSTNTVQVIRETVLQVRRPKQQYQSTEGKATKENPEKANNKIHTYIQNTQ